MSFRGMPLPALKMLPETRIMADIYSTAVIGTCQSAKFTRLREFHTVPAFESGTGDGSPTPAASTEANNILATPDETSHRGAMRPDALHSTRLADPACFGLGNDRQSFGVNLRGHPAHRRRRLHRFAYLRGTAPRGRGCRCTRQSCQQQPGGTSARRAHHRQDG